MATGTIEFVASVKGLRFETIEVSNQHLAIEKIVLKAQDERMNIVFHLDDVFDSEEAAGIANDILPSIINRLAFYSNSPIGEPHSTGGSLPKDASGSSYTVWKDLNLRWGRAVPVLTLGDDKRKELARLLERPYTSNYLYSAYRFAINQDDPVARFMFLYNILLLLNRDKQKQVNNFIRSEMPSVPLSPRPDNPNVIETVYTRLRNEVGHSRAGTAPEQTRKAIQNEVEAFQELVKTAISRVVP